MPKLKPFAYVVMVLVGEGGAGPHDIVRMMREGRWFWNGSESQFYAEPKRLEDLGYLVSHTEPGVTRERTVYHLTDLGREALTEWLGQPANLPKVQEEQIVRLLGSEFVPDEVVVESLSTMRQQLEADLESIRFLDQRAESLPHRARALHINHRLARRMIEAHLAWLDEVEAEYGEDPGRG